MKTGKATGVMEMNDHHYSEMAKLALVVWGMTASYLWSASRGRLYFGLGISFIICVGSILAFRLSAFVSIICLCLFIFGFTIASLYKRRVDRHRFNDFDYPEFFLLLALVYVGTLIIYLFR